MSQSTVKFKSIYINVIDTEFTPGKKLCKGKEHLQPLFADYIAKLMVDDLVKAIDKQRFNSKWKPLSPSYLEWKKKNNLSTKIWKATGNMQSSIYKINRKDKVLVGVTSKRKYPNTNSDLLTVAKRLEFGTSKSPARPLFRPIYNNYSKHIDRYWKRFLKTQN